MLLDCMKTRHFCMLNVRHFWQAKTGLSTELIVVGSAKTVLPLLLLTMASESAVDGQNCEIPWPSGSVRPTPGLPLWPPLPDVAAGQPPRLRVDGPADLRMPPKTKEIKLNFKFCFGLDEFLLYVKHLVGYCPLRNSEQKKKSNFNQ